MRKLFMMAGVLFAAITGNAQDQQISNVLKVNTDNYSFGKIKQGVPVTMNFELTNITDKPIVIENASAQCGCTTPEVPKEPIAPGQTVKLKVGYNASAMGIFTKDVTIKIAGVSQPKIVKITGETLTADAYEAYKKTQSTSKTSKGGTSVKTAPKVIKPAATKK